MAGSMSELMIMLPAFYLMNQIDWTVPEHMLYVRIAYATATSITLSILAYLYTRITAKNDKTKITLPPAPYSGTEALQTTVAEYDIQQLKKVASQTLLSVVIICGIHYQWAIIQPLFIQCIMGPMQVFKSPLFKIFVLGQKGEIERRPFKEESPFASLMPQQETAPTTNNTPDDDDVEEESDDDGTARVKEITEEDEKKINARKDRKKQK